MTRDDLIKFCRYYGKNRNTELHTTFSDYEEKWIELTLAHSLQLGEYLTDYLRAGLTDFEKFDDTPATLKALLFNRYCKWNSASMLDCVEPFKKFYKEKYL